ncbi:hypothetical protein WICMUC_001572 [Wickerhamomyces mucosus]|uniref:Uncharacterized protein n=1 Tax=Wickerhamomyces mucosus TaxID=1378264 RepID=A0A9P8PVV7_9ASCO|nr:hypothetical protein WICMUC_001572 [Wickerhamomyces mucosus]
MIFRSILKPTLELLITRIDKFQNNSPLNHSYQENGTFDEEYDDDYDYDYEVNRGKNMNDGSIAQIILENRVIDYEIQKEYVNNAHLDFQINELVNFKSINKVNNGIGKKKFSEIVERFFLMIDKDDRYELLSRVQIDDGGGDDVDEDDEKLEELDKIDIDGNISGLSLVGYLSSNIIPLLKNSLPAPNQESKEFFLKNDRNISQRDEGEQDLQQLITKNIKFINKLILNKKFLMNLLQFLIILSMILINFLKSFQSVLGDNYTYRDNNKIGFDKRSVKKSMHLTSIN